jgi:hypothetical protein
VGVRPGPTRNLVVKPLRGTRAKRRCVAGTAGIQSAGLILGQMASMGESGGQFFGLHVIAADSKGNICRGEVFAGERLQKFVR